MTAAILTWSHATESWEHIFEYLTINKRQLHMRQDLNCSLSDLLTCNFRLLYRSGRIMRETVCMYFCLNDRQFIYFTLDIKNNKFKVNRTGLLLYIKICSCFPLFINPQWSVISAHFCKLQLYLVLVMYSDWQKKTVRIEESQSAEWCLTQMIWLLNF